MTNERIRLRVSESANFVVVMDSLRMTASAHHPIAELVHQRRVMMKVSARLVQSRTTNGCHSQCGSV